MNMSHRFVARTAVAVLCAITSYSADCERASAQRTIFATGTGQMEKYDIGQTSPVFLSSTDLGTTIMHVDYDQVADSLLVKSAGPITYEFSTTGAMQTVFWLPSSYASSGYITDLAVAYVPEPGSIPLLGFVAMLIARRRMKCGTYESK